LLAHIVLTFIQSGYVWQDGDKDPAKVYNVNICLFIYLKVHNIAKNTTGMYYTYI